MDSIYEFTPPIHMAIISMTGAGKSWLASRIFDNTSFRSVYFNYSLTPYFKKYFEVSNEKDFVKAMELSRKVVVNSTDVNLIERITKYLWELKKSNNKFAIEDIYLWYDECQKYSQAEFMTDVFNLGRPWKIHGIAICRQIQEMKNLRIISECQHMVFLHMNDVGLSTLQNNYRIKVPDFVLHYVNKGEYEGIDYKSDFYSALYDSITWFIYDKKGQFVTKYNVLKGYDVDDQPEDIGEPDRGEKTPKITADKDNTKSDKDTS